MEFCFKGSHEVFCLPPPLCKGRCPVLGTEGFLVSSENQENGTTPVPSLQRRGGENTMISEKLRNKKPLKKRRQKLRNEATHHEVILWSRLRRSQLGYKFRRQYSIGGFVLDFYCPERQLAVELDGWQHGESDSQHYDSMRTRYLEEFGTRVVRFWNGEVDQNLEGVISKIEECLCE